VKPGLRCEESVTRLRAMAGPTEEKWIAFRSELWSPHSVWLAVVSVWAEPWDVHKDGSELIGFYNMDAVFRAGRRFLSFRQRVLK
jgi:hypothetical protein